MENAKSQQLFCAEKRARGLKFAAISVASGAELIILTIWCFSQLSFSGMMIFFKYDEREKEAAATLFFLVIPSYTSRRMDA